MQKNIGHHVYLRAKDHFTSSPGPWIEKQHHVLRRRPCSFPRLGDFYALYRMCSAKLRNNLDMTS